MRKLTDDSVSLDDDLLACLIAYDPFPTSDRDSFGRLVVDRNKVSEWVWSVWWRLERRHKDDFVDDYSEIGQFAESGAHPATIYRSTHMKSLTRWKHR